VAFACSAPYKERECVVGDAAAAFVDILWGLKEKLQVTNNK
jgi:hypothetical protein